MSHTDRGTGKTTRLIAQGVVDCLARRGQWVELRDHYDQQNQHEYVAQGVGQVLTLMNVQFEQEPQRIKVVPV